MASASVAATKPHALCIPYPAQGHITPMLQLAKLLHHKGFHITFVNSEYNHHRLLKSNGPSSLDGLPDFRYETIPDGLPPSDTDGTQDIVALCESTMTTCLRPLCDLITKLNSTAPYGAPPVTCIVSDGAMSFTLDAAQEFGIPEVLIWTTSACGFLAYIHYEDLVSRGLTPLKDVSYLSNGYLDTPVEGMAGLVKDIRLRDFPSFIRTLDPNDFMVRFAIRETERASRAKAVIINSFDEFERPALEALARTLASVYTIGPLHLLSNHNPDSPVASMGSNLWKEETSCLQWLDTKAAGAIVYVNFGSITMMTNQQLVEFAWGLCDSNRHFLWVIRPDLVRGDSAVLPEEFLEKTKDRGLLVSWCSQEQLLGHPAVGGFLMHCGWNSTLESVCAGTPMLCWPFFAEQQTNCRYSCTEWGVGLEVDNDVKREEIAVLIRELMGGDKGKEMRRRAREWKEAAIVATRPGGSSSVNLDKLVNDVLLSNHQV